MNSHRILTENDFLSHQTHNIYGKVKLEKRRKAMDISDLESRRANPDELLRTIQKQEEASRRGHLKIFFGYAAGVGKTFAMLKAAHEAMQQNIDVVVGYVEPHMRPKTMALLEGLEQIPTKQIPCGSIKQNEFDLDLALSRAPALILVDELAHTNAQGARHQKRYQDIEELLSVGIDVYTTVNVQHIESLCDMVASITGITVNERIPDKVFDQADQVELVDIEPDALIERLQEGNVYREAQAAQALNNFFSTANLTALREIALRRCADRVNRIVENTRIEQGGDYYTEEHILVCLSSSPANPKIIRTASRMAQALHGRLTALFVKNPSFVMSEDDQKRLQKNIRLAEQLGASIETSYGDDVALQISEYARISGISKIVLGRSSAKRNKWFGNQTLTEKLISYAPNLDIYIIPETISSNYRPPKSKRHVTPLSVSDIVKCTLLLIAATIISSLFDTFGFSEANIITIYILGVLMCSVLASSRICSFVFSIVSVLVFNFCFTEPRFTLNANDASYPATFFIMFAASLITGNLATKLKQHAQQSADTAYRTKVMFDTNQSLQKATDKEEIIKTTAQQLVRLLNRDVIFYMEEDDRLSDPYPFAASDNLKNQDCLSVNEQAVATWVFKNNNRAGASTNTLANAKCLYLAIRIGNHVYGVVGIALLGDSLMPEENSILLSILGECAMALENQQTVKDKEAATVLAKNEQLRANLLRSISHDLRTPLTSISGNANILLANGDLIEKEKRKELYTNIYEDALWLIELVENLLTVTRIQNGTTNLPLKPELMDEIIAEAIQHIDRKSKEHFIIVEDDDVALAKMDAKLIVQVMVNLLNNAIEHTPSGSHITVHTYVKNKQVVTEVIDDGPGVPDAEKPHIFDMFYTSDTKIMDSHRSTGLGLALCQSIIDAHNGKITVMDNFPKGSIFQFTLPVEEVTLHE